MAIDKLRDAHPSSLKFTPAFIELNENRSELEELMVLTLIEDHIHNAFNLTGQLLVKCESEIEKAFVAALVCGGTYDGCELFGSSPHSFGNSPWQLFITPQYKIGKYRCDFLVEYEVEDWHHDPEQRLKNYSSVIIECDGHDYHERTKEQAKRDRAKDRFLTLQDIKFLRFTGSEIHNDPDGCFKQTIKLLKSQLKLVNKNEHQNINRSLYAPHVRWAD